MEGTVAGKHCYLLCVLSHKEKRETVIFTNILLQLWGVISGLLQCLCSMRHKSLKLFPIFDSSVFPLISGLSPTFNTCITSKFPIAICMCGQPGSRLSSLSHRLLWTPEPGLESHFPKAAQPQDAASLSFWSPTQGDFQSSELKQKFGLSSGQKGPWHSCKIRQNCAVKRHFSCTLRTSQWEVTASDKGIYISNEKNYFSFYSSLIMSQLWFYFLSWLATKLWMIR